MYSELRRSSHVRLLPYLGKTDVPLGELQPSVGLAPSANIHGRFGEARKHAYGDEVLSSLAQILERSVRESDIVGRWGGEEFIVICANVDEARVMELAEKLPKRVESFQFGDGERITASFGTYWCAPGFSDLPPLVTCADMALYAAKARGRNRSVRYDSSLKTAA